ncbi:putative glycosyltransferase EpsH [compost metagenome]
MNDPLISLIIPCYNAESTVSKCLASVKNQTYKDLEIIVINDGSTDDTLEIIKRFQKDDLRIILIDQNNTGVSKARNLGIQKAGGEYICFVDSDDWVEKDYCGSLYNALIKTNADISIAEAFYEDEKGNKIENHQLNNSSTSVYDNKTALQLLLEDKIIQSHPWAKLYKSRLLKNIAFPENLEAFEDYYTMFKVFNNAEKVVKIGKPLYHYVQFENSLSHNLTPKRAYHFFLALMEAYAFLNSHHIDKSFKKSILKNILKKTFMVLKRIIRNTNSDEMLAEKENIRNGLSVFLPYSPFQIGLEKYLYLRFFINYPDHYSRFIKK